MGPTPSSTSCEQTGEHGGRKCHSHASENNGCGCLSLKHMLGSCSEACSHSLWAGRLVQSFCFVKKVSSTNSWLSETSKALEVPVWSTSFVKVALSNEHIYKLCLALAMLLRTHLVTHPSFMDYITGWRPSLLGGGRF